MPYIKQERRKRLDSTIDNILAFLQEVKEEDRDGEINYIITRILVSVFQPPKYYRYERAIGCLECAKLEFYRIFVQAYEELKRIENGSVE